MIGEQDALAEGRRRHRDCAQLLVQVSQSERWACHSLIGRWRRGKWGSATLESTPPCTTNVRRKTYLKLSVELCP